MFVYHTAQNFGGRKLRRIVASKYLGGQNIGGLAALHSKIAIGLKQLADKTLADQS